MRFDVRCNAFVNAEDAARSLRRGTRDRHGRGKNRNMDLAVRRKKCQFRDIRPKAPSEIVNLEETSKLLGHTTKQIT